ncbi:MAG: protease modulator HflC [Burkholderiaceae bacterium]|nr:protease modulator HflC [Burkholderiaceae bacterium]
MQRFFPYLVGLVIALAVLSSCVFVVRERDYALQFTLGEVRRVITEPGLYFKAPPPFQNVIRLDKRILTIESTDAERIQTAEKKNLLIDSYVKWRISDPRRYYVSFLGNESGAQQRPQALIRDALNAAVNVRTVQQVVATERDKVMAEIVTNVARRSAELGVEIVDVRLRRIEFAPEISESVYRRMEAERSRVANELRSLGAAESEKLRANADRQREEIVARAYASAQAVMGDGDAEASRIYAEAYNRDPSFFTFYKSLEAYRTAFSKPSDILVVDPSSDFFQFMKSVNGRGAMATPGQLPKPTAQ